MLKASGLKQKQKQDEGSLVWTYDFKCKTGAMRLQNRGPSMWYRWSYTGDCDLSDLTILPTVSDTCSISVQWLCVRSTYIETMCLFNRLFQWIREVESSFVFDRSNWQSVTLTSCCFTENSYLRFLIPH